MVEPGRAVPRDAASHGASSHGASPRGAAGAGLAVGVAALAAAGVWLTWRVFGTTAGGQRADFAAMEGARTGRTQLWRVAEPALEVISVGFLAAVLVAAVVVALVRRRWLLVGQVALVMAGANLSTQLVKAQLTRPDLGGFGHSVNSYPSGHTTAAASAAVALLLVVPQRLRPATAWVGAVFTAGIGVSTLVGQWHRPSDVVGAVLVVLAWGALAVGVAPLVRSSTPTPLLAPSSTPAPSPAPRPGVAALVAASALAGLVAAVALWSTWAAADPLATTARTLVAYGGGVAGVVAASGGALAGLARLTEVVPRGRRS